MRATNGRLVKVATCFEDQAPSLADLNDDDLLARRTELSGEMATLSAIDTADLTDEQVDRMEEIGASLTAIRVESARRVVASATAPEEPVAPEAAPEAADEEDEEDEVEVGSPATTPQPEALVAAAPRGPAPAARRSGPVSEPPATAKANRMIPFTAAADVPGHPAGATLDIAKVAEAFVKKASSLPKMSGRSRFSNSYGIAQITKEFDPRAIVAGNDAEEVLKFVSNEKNTPKGSLVASGGWCAPSETLYELAAENETTEGLYSLPEVLAARGGFNTTLGPDFADIFTDTGFCFTEGQDIAGDYNPESPGNQGKPCFKVECPDFTETRLDVCGLCISAGYLQNRAYPELTQRTIRGALVAHQHRMAGRVLADVIAGSTEIDSANLDLNPGAVAPVLEALELQILDMRYRVRMGVNRSMEVIAPIWAKGLLRADLSRRLGVDMLSVPDARLNAWFAERGANVQWVYNFDDLSGSGFNQWPDTIRFVVYPAGTWIRASSDVIDLGVIHDSTQFAFNNFTALFTEEGWAVIKRGFDSRVVSVRVCASGVTGAGANLVCSDESPA
jgi:hypothetical protein